MIIWRFSFRLAFMSPCFLVGVKDSAFEFKGKQDSFLEIPNDGKLDTKNSISILANIYPTGEDGPIVNFKKNGWGVHIWQFDKSMLFVRFVSRDDSMTTQPLATRVLQVSRHIAYCYCPL